MEALNTKTYRLTPSEVTQALAEYVARNQECPAGWEGESHFGLTITTPSQPPPPDTHARVTEVLVTLTWPVPPLTQPTP